jgi:hypothetical protein
MRICYWFCYAVWIKKYQREIKLSTLFSKLNLCIFIEISTINGEMKIKILFNHFFLPMVNFSCFRTINRENHLGMSKLFRQTNISKCLGNACTFTWFDIVPFETPKKFSMMENGTGSSISRRHTVKEPIGSWYEHDSQNEELLIASANNSLYCWGIEMKSNSKIGSCERISWSM